LLQGLKKIEKALGRVRLEPKGPRTIDLDIIFYNDLNLSDPGLEIPHPRFRQRGFVLFPLNDIIPGFIDPKTQKPIHQLLKEWRKAGGKSLKYTGWL
jgi:2-amino-4-hydroxy-6-hydroxymethyldihydropteridine diphosphokinase